MDNPVITDSTRRNWHSLILSLALHSVLMLLILGSFSRLREPVAQKLRRGGIVLAVAPAELKPEYLTEQDSLDSLEIETPQIDQRTSTAPVSTAVIPPSVGAVTTPTVPEFFGPRSADSLVIDANRLTDVPQPQRLPTEFQLTADDLAMIETDRNLIKSRRPVGDPATISVFGGGQLTGRDFVFVLDRSKSMGSSGLGVIEAARTELSLAIGKLEPHHQFQIIGYHDRTVTMSKRQMLPANAENKAGIAQFVGDLVAFGGTQHENGLVAGIAFRPDVIVLLTDGGYPELNAGQLKMIRQLAGGKTQIHCMQFGSGPLQKQTNFMTQLAEQNQGSYQYIDVNQWKKMP